MNEELSCLEEKKVRLCKELQEISDFRRGSVSAIFRKCGKKNCVCAQEGHPGHGPQYIWSATIDGKSHAKNLKLGTEMEKYLEEVSNYKQFLKISDEIIAVNEAICAIRPARILEEGNSLEALKKKLQQIFEAKYKKK